MKNPLSILSDIIKAHWITLSLDSYYYDVCMKRYPRLKIIPNKKYLVALMDEYHRDAYEIRKSIRAGNVYRIFECYNTDMIVDMIHINLSTPIRQAKQLPDYMSNEYLYLNHFKGKSIHGIFKGDKLIAYADVVKYGDVNVIGPFMGHADYLKEGIMYHLFDQFALKYPLMYDTFLGNTPGLTYFKKKLGFKAYNVRWQVKGE